MGHRRPARHSAALLVLALLAAVVAPGWSFLPAGAAGPSLSDTTTGGAAQTSAVGAPDDPYWPQQWSHRVSRAVDAWDVTVGSRHVVVAVLDSGVAQVPELRGRLVSGWDFVDDDDDPDDPDGHGTMVAGVVAAAGGNDAGVAGWCWVCRIMPVRVLDEEGWADYADIAAGIVWAVDHGADIVNLSLVGERSSRVVAEAVEYARAHDVLVFAAAGNGACDCPQYPAASPGVIAVAATDRDDRRFPTSNYGDWVDVAAPGHTLTQVPGGDIWFFEGTSAAAPAVAGIAALALSHDPTASAAEVEAALSRTAVPVGDMAQAGRVDAGATLAAVGASPAAQRPARGAG